MQNRNRRDALELNGCSCASAANNRTRGSRGIDDPCRRSKLHLRRTTTPESRQKLNFALQVQVLAGEWLSSKTSLLQTTFASLTVHSARLQNPAPLDYATPPFPSLYWPYKAKPGVANYLYYAHDIWRYTLLWTLIIFAVFHMVVAAFAVLMQLGKGKRAWQYVWIIPLIYAIIAGIEAILAGSFVGLM